MMVTHSLPSDIPSLTGKADFALGEALSDGKDTSSTGSPAVGMLAK